ncbi:short chain dehydrogenase reductase family [Fusarium albosuccineum]|uniref:Short chain dehydrogenase reductase family n=1 Tax=Fusarium albosuccineum TaxID=1237068 RepID=A0A8H4PI93_9HYPO|nr:short chain dehydrogenase reductase family [Fusarium albosuccineum]
MAPEYLHKLRGKSIVIVGGTSGVGFAVAEACLEFGAELVIVSRSQENVDRAVHRLQASYPDAATSIQGYTCDLMSGQAEADIVKVFDLATQNGTNLVDHVISTAGSLPKPMTLADATSDDLVADSKYHFIGDLLLAKVVVRYLKPTYTSSITMTGGAGTFKPPPGWPLWAGVGGAKDALTRSLAVELKPIRVNIVSLGAIRTELFDGAVADWGAEAIDATMKASPLNKIGDPQDVAETYLALIKNHFATGTINFVEGGALLV